jgi:integration host factor subunit beta
MTKADLADAVYRRHGALSRREAVLVVDRILDHIRRGLAAGHPVKISGFGSFLVVRRRARTGRNPRTGQRVSIPDRTAPVFRPSRQVVHQLNSRPGMRAE